MMTKICALAVLAAVMGYVLSELGFRGKRAVDALSFVVLLIGAVRSLPSFTALIGEAALSQTGEIAQAALKIVGAGYVFGITSDIASELGEGGISKAAELAGRIEMIVIVVPYLKEVIGLALEMIK